MMATTPMNYENPPRSPDQGATFGFGNPALAGAGKINNPPSPPFSKGGMGGFETYLLSNS